MWNSFGFTQTKLFIYIKIIIFFVRLIYKNTLKKSFYHEISLHFFLPLFNLVKTKFFLELNNFLSINRF